MDPWREREELLGLIGGVRRSKHQINKPFEADVEILKFSDRYLVSSTDTIGEEISDGLYRNPYLWGWMCVMSSISDLAASGARPLGLLISAEWARHSSQKTRQEVYRGIREALQATDTPLLGGDTGRGKSHVLTSTILGESKTKPLTRLGTKAGDSVFLLGPSLLGAGPALALRFLQGASPRVFPESMFRPRPDWKTMARLRPHLSAAIDTSDGLATSLAILGRLNNVGFRLKWQPSTLMPEARRAMKALDLPEPLLWMSDLGDLQVLMTARPQAARLLRKNPSLVEIGVALPANAGYSIEIGEEEMDFPVSWVTRAGRDLDSLTRLYRRLHRHFRAANLLA